MPVLSLHYAKYANKKEDIHNVCRIYYVYT